MTIAVDLGRKATKNKTILFASYKDTYLLHFAILIKELVKNCGFSPQIPKDSVFDKNCKNDTNTLYYTQYYTRHVLIQVKLIPPRKHCLWWIYCFHVVCPSVRPCVRPSVTLCFLNILKSHCWIFIKPCKHVHICKTNTLNKKVRARGQFYQSYFPL